MGNADAWFLSRRALLGACAAAIPAARHLFSAQPPPAPPSTSQPAVPSFAANVKVVNVFATVRDKKGKIVQNLTKDDFAISEDGRPQTIRYFARQSDLPLTLGLLVDTSGSERRMIGTEREASYTFFDQVLRPDRDKAFLIHFDREVELLQDLTSSRERLQKALDELAAPQWNHARDDPGGDANGGSNPGGWGQRGGGQRRSRGGTTLYDAIYLASNDLMKKQRGRRALILLTDGEDRGSKVSLSEAIDAAQRASTLVYSIRIHSEERFRGDFPGGMRRHGGWGGGPGGGGPWNGGGMGGHRGGYPRAERPDGKKVLEQISKETGGGYFEVSKKKNINDIYSQIEEELRNQYSLGYTPEKSAQPGFRKLEVTVRRKGCAVRAREGYYASANS